MTVKIWVPIRSCKAFGGNITGMEVTLGHRITSQNPDFAKIPTEQYYQFQLNITKICLSPSYSCI